MKTETRRCIRYGEAFKMQVVEEIASGKFDGACSASRAYGIKGAQTVRSWLIKYGREELLPKQVTISTVQETQENKLLKKRVKELEKALADSYMKGLLDQSFLQIACERMGLPVDEFKKKHVTSLSEKPGPKAKR